MKFKRRLLTLSLPVFVFLLSGAVPFIAAAQEQGQFSFKDAQNHGVFNIGASQGHINLVKDDQLGTKIMAFDFTLPANTAVGIWTQHYPEQLNADTVSTIKVSLKAHDAEEASQVDVHLEIKGTNSVQRIPLALTDQWQHKEQAIDWASIGKLKEVVLVVTPKEGIDVAKGRLYFNFNLTHHLQAPSAKAAETGKRHFTIEDAAAHGVFNIGTAQGTITKHVDEISGREGLRFDYQAAKDAMIGVWTKDYPKSLNSKKINALNIGIVSFDSAARIEAVSVVVEIKGDKNKQVVPVPLRLGRTSYRTPIHWKTIGNLKEVVFVVSPKKGEAVTGQFDFYLTFNRLTWLERISTKLGLVLLLALLLGAFGWLWTRGSHSPAKDIKAAEENKFNFKKDLFYGPAILLIVVVAFGIYWLGTTLGTMNPGKITESFLLLALLGGVIGQLFKRGATGKNLTALEMFQNVLITGILAATSSNQVLLQTPASWAQVLMKSNLTAMVTFLIYQVINAVSLIKTRRHIKFMTGVLVAGIPYLFGWLLILQNPDLLQNMGSTLSIGLVSHWPAVSVQLGRLVVVFLFNEMLVNAISLATQGGWIRKGRAHLIMFAVSVAVILSPIIADLGSNEVVGSWPILLRAVVAVLTTVLAQAGLWGEVYLITGVTLDAGNRIVPSSSGIFGHISTGMKKGMMYSGILMTLLYLLKMALDNGASHLLMAVLPIVLGTIVGALLFPLVKTIIETFDGSMAFIVRMRYSYRNAVLYCRGAVVGFGFAYMIKQGLFQLPMSDRMTFGLIIGLIASLGVSLGRDIVYAFSRKGKVQSWRLYLIDALLGGFVGSAVAFYLDSSQVPVIIEKFKLYTSAGFAAKDYVTFPLVNKWGRIDLGTYTGGVRLLFTESLAGVINWSVAAWLFAINRAFLEAVFQRQKAPIMFLFSRAGLAELLKHMIQVLRWGLWMSPIIFTFLRMMDVPTWYNQDGAIRTLVAIYHDLTMSHAQFQAWSLNVFIYLLAFDWFRILIWIDHMGLRVATLVNLSFIGMNKLDEKIAKFIGPAAAQRYIPEAVKRFTTWAPLLLPFYLPRGKDWSYAWTTSAAMHNAAAGQGVTGLVRNLSLPEIMLVLAAGLLVCTGLSSVFRVISRKRGHGREKTFKLGNPGYKVTYRGGGETYSTLVRKDYDLTRRAYDPLDPSGRLLFLLDQDEAADSPKRVWPVVGNHPKKQFVPSSVKMTETDLIVENRNHGIRAKITITIPEANSPAELWTISLENQSQQMRHLKIIPYLEWLLSRGMDDRFHPQYSRLFPVMHYSDQGNAVLAWHKKTKLMGILAADIVPEGYLTSRMDFIGRAKTVWKARVFETLAFEPARSGETYPTFDPIGSLMLGMAVAPQEKKTVRLLIGAAKDEEQAVELINRCLRPGFKPVGKAADTKAVKKTPLIGHGEILPGTPQPYFEYRDNGNKLLIPTPYTPRPFDHAMSNAAGHTVIVTNRGLHTTCNGNSQQNRLTPDGPDTVTRETPGEAIYLYDPQQQEWYSPTHHPVNASDARQEAEFGVDGTAIFRMEKGSLATELTVFVPPHDPLGVYLLKIKNKANHPRRLRVAPYFQMVLELQPERSGKLIIKEDNTSQALFFENPRNTFRSGPAFAAMSIPAEKIETNRARFFGGGRPVGQPCLVETGQSDNTVRPDQSNVAAFLGTVEVPANGESMVAVILGQTDTKPQARQLVANYKSIDHVLDMLQQTKAWWNSLMSTVQLKTNNPNFDYMQNWLKYQAIVERLWARRGFYQSSGAYGFRDQLQDTVNLMWMDPALARKQIKLHASQQFLEGDVFHWFFTLTDGRTGFASRSHASDNLLWLVWGVVEYLKATGDESLLDEMTSYVTSEIPFLPLPNNKGGWGDLYQRSTRADTIYHHCLKSIDLVLEKRTGRNGLPLIGTGDWNDGLDEIGSEGIGESVWLGLFLTYILKYMLGVIEKKDGSKRKAYYAKRLAQLEQAVENTWRGDRYLRAIHDDGTEIGVKGSGVWEIDALTAAWAVMADINAERGQKVFHTALEVLEKENVILLGWPALREDTKPYLGRSSTYPEGVRENGMYCHGVQWLIGASRLLAERHEARGDAAKADEYRAIAYRLWMKITPLIHATPEEIEVYGGQPNKQAADLLTTFDQGRMIWNGYTGAAGWLFRQAMEGVIGASLRNNQMELPKDMDKNRGALKITSMKRDLSKSPL